MWRCGISHNSSQTLSFYPRPLASIEHVGFKVENVDAVKKELAALRESDAEMRERIIAEPSEGERRTALIAGCRHCQHVTSSPDGVFVDICG